MMINTVLRAPALAEIRAAKNSLAPYVNRSPMVRLNTDGRSSDIFLKLECMQPIGAFKVRPMANALLKANPDMLKRGVYTASSGNAGLGLAWTARKLDLAATVYAPITAPAEKIAAIRRIGAEVRQLSEHDWWQIIRNGGYPDDPGLYIDAVRNRAAMAGNGTIGLEIIEQLPDVTTVIVPFGGGGLLCGIAAAIRGLKPDTRLVVAESAAAAPLTGALDAGHPVQVEMQRSFISGAGAACVLDEMWPLIRDCVDETIVTPVADVAAAIALIFENNRVIAEGAGAIAVAAALADQRRVGKTVCVVSGGNIDASELFGILRAHKL